MSQPAPVMWGFPARRPQLFATSPTALAMGTAVHSFGRNLPAPLHFGLSLAVALPMIRRSVTSAGLEFAPDCGWDVWCRVRDVLVVGASPDPAHWVYYRSRWRKRRSSALALSRGGSPVMFVSIEPVGERSFHPHGNPLGFRVPQELGAFAEGEWLVRRFEPLPRFHRPQPWQGDVVANTARSLTAYLEERVSRPEGLPGHWKPMHGDFVPWNLRVDRGGCRWLLDWEDVGWAPPNADLLRFATSLESMSRHSESDSVKRLRRRMGGEDADLVEAATFWLDHRNLRLPRGRPDQAQIGEVPGRARVKREAAILRQLVAER